MRYTFYVAAVLFLISPLNSMNNVKEEVSCYELFEEKNIPNLSDIVLNHGNVKERCRITFAKYDLDLSSEFLLSKKFSSWSDYSIRELVFDQCVMDKDFGFSFLGGTQLEKIKITGCNLKAKHLENLFKFLEYSLLDEVDLSNNMLNDDEDTLFESVYDACAYKFGLGLLNLQDNGLSEKIKDKMRSDPNISLVSELML